ncbi:MAG: Gfo/Idh/MocA family oxidoreductase [Planctomycetes bacterium]|nr:Gfo/Idh/MocA family oxidoreductase [Planctomycetota bacterium]MBI3846899.1 Gfo/Idh/MocA family oxidoreductase [Planctomycetota bacterium]
MKKRLGVGIVGAGFVSRFHVRSWVGVRDADVLGVCSRSIEKAEAVAKLARDLDVGEAKAYRTVTEMVKAPGIDAIWICVPNFARLSVMEEIAAAGKGKIVGIACEKPLGRNVKEAKRMVDLAPGFLHAYLENDLFMPPVVRGKDALWRRGATSCGRPYLARAAEEHGGPHEPWFWSGKQQGGGVLSDMMCHSIEAARFLLTDPAKGRDSLKPRTVNCDLATLKWSRPEYAAKLRAMSRGAVDYAKAPAEDFARASVAWETDDGLPVVTEATTSWCFVGPGLRLSFEVMGPEYYMQGNSLTSHLDVFFSREVKSGTGEDLVEKQTAETGLMPVVTNEEMEYGYVDENRHVVQRFLSGKPPMETFHDGLEVSRLLMALYMSAERNERLAWPPAGLDEFIPAVQREAYSTKDVFKGR